MVAANPDRFARVVIGNTGLPTGDRNPGKAFLAWQKFSQTSPTFDIGSLIDAATITELSPGEVAAYDAPFPDDTYKAGARIFPTLVPTSPDDPEAPANREAWTVFEAWEKPFVCCFSDSDPITAGGEAAFIGRIPGTAGQPHVTDHERAPLLPGGRGRPAGATPHRRHRSLSTCGVPVPRVRAIQAPRVSW